MANLKTQKQHDPVNHPSHYTHGAIEVIDAIEAWNLPFHLGNAVKYIARAGHKVHPGVNAGEAELEDLKKAQWYLNRYISNLEEEV